MRTIKEKRILFNSCVQVKNTLYAFTSFAHFIVKFDLKTKKLELVKGLKNYKPFITQDIKNDEESIYALELNGKRMSQYHISSHECFYFNIDCDKKGWGNYAAFAKRGNYIYIFPKYTNALVRIDMQENAVYKETQLYTESKYAGEAFQKDEDACFVCGCQCMDTVWLFQDWSNTLVAYDLSTSTWQKYEIPMKVRNCVHIIHYNDVLYILSSEGRVYTWNINDCSMELITDCTSEEEEKNKFSRIAVTDKMIVMLPGSGKDIVCISPDTKCTWIYRDYPKQFHYCAPDFWSKYCGFCENEEKYYFAMRSANYILCIDKRNSVLQWIKPIPFPNEEEFLMFTKYYKNKLLSEEDWALRDLLECINSEDDKEKNSIDRICGEEKIWGVLKKS